MKGANARDLRKLSGKELDDRLDELRNTLLHEKKSTKTRPVKKAIARILTIKNELKSSKISNTSKSKDFETRKIKKTKKIEVKKVG